MPSSMACSGFEIEDFLWPSHSQLIFWLMGRYRGSSDGLQMIGFVFGSASEVALSAAFAATTAAPSTNGVVRPQTPRIMALKRRKDSRLYTPVRHNRAQTTYKFLKIM
uniref:(northern house mosquito) hypothetical protein n=1 Tax=Culex pipiens TaxID=7175 RepID=A0A8D8NGQ2_CULPI